MPRWPAARARVVEIEHKRDGDVAVVSAGHNVRELSQLDRRARAFDHVRPLLLTSIPTVHVFESYLHELDKP